MLGAENFKCLSVFDWFPVHEGDFLSHLCALAVIVENTCILKSLPY